MNLVILNGNVVVDPTTKHFENGYSVTKSTFDSQSESSVLDSQNTASANIIP